MRTNLAGLLDQFTAESSGHQVITYDELHVALRSDFVESRAGGARLKAPQFGSMDAAFNLRLLKGTAGGPFARIRDVALQPSGEDAFLTPVSQREYQIAFLWRGCSQ